MGSSVLFWSVELCFAEFNNFNFPPDDLDGHGVEANMAFGLNIEGTREITVNLGIVTTACSGG